MNRIMAITITLLLCSCQSAEEKRAEWVKFCIEGEFSPKQCMVLYSLKESSDASKDAAAVAQISSGMAFGVIAAQGSRR